MTELILASKSAARIALLTGAGLSFETTGAGVDEDAFKVEALARGEGPKEVAVGLSALKALAVSERRSGLVIGADQTLDLGGVTVDKAESVEEARARLKDMRGRVHHLHSGVAVAEEGRVVWSTVETATLSVRDFSDAWLDGYLARQGQTILSSVGCYQLEGEGVQLFDRIEGDYFTILGLPMVALLGFLRERGLVQA
ncbi:Maf family protein [Caulobacter sp. 17J80-11]|uniref:Maf family protein n=1 Tax=Caulobacter sp. 17J80-11 TaxID=2763502 RepID=UPI0016538EEB|nr:Maf family protein [Caulobacter sp. 17J80-11]